MECLFLFEKRGESSGWVSSAATGNGALVGVAVAIKNNRNKNNRSRRMSNNNNNNNNQSTASSSHRRLHSSSSIKMMTSQSHLSGIDNEAFALTPTDNTCCANVAYDYNNDDYDVRDNEDQIGSLCCLSVPHFKFEKKIYAHLAA